MTGNSEAEKENVSSRRVYLHDGLTDPTLSACAYERICVPCAWMATQRLRWPRSWVYRLLFPCCEQRSYFPDRNGADSRPGGPFPRTWAVGQSVVAKPDLPSASFP
jgi:hypothetical protein